MAPAAAAGQSRDSRGVSLGGRQSIAQMEKEINPKLVKVGQPPLTEEELVAGRLYTGPMYFKYNAVLRQFTGDPFLVDAWKKACGPAPYNNYVSTIHAINSCVIKLCKLTKAGKVWRGTCYGKLPEEFWVPNSEGVLGGIEYGFQSTTRGVASETLLLVLRGRTRGRCHVAAAERLCAISANDKSELGFERTCG